MATLTFVAARQARGGMGGLGENESQGVQFGIRRLLIIALTISQKQRHARRCMARAREAIKDSDQQGRTFMQRTNLITVRMPRAAISRLIVLSAVSVGCLLTPVALAEQAVNSTIVAGYRFTSFDAPGAAGGLGTDPHHINNDGAITGNYWDSNGVRHGFVRNKGGVITSFDPQSSVNTDAEGINDSGDIVGRYRDANSAFHGFLRDHKGTMTSIDVPFPGNQGTTAHGINAEGTVLGVYFDANGNPQIFLRTCDGRFTAVNPSGDVFGAFAHSINDRGAISGTFIDSNSVYQGFLRQANGLTITFEAPLAGTGSGQGTLPTNINQGSHNALNERGDLTGSAVDANYTGHGFLRTHDGEFVSFDVPGTGVGNYNGTWPSSINSSGTILGTSFDNNGAGHGFVRYGDGNIVPFDAPGAVSAQGGTVAYGINDAGAIVGAWVDASGIIHGFVMTRKDDD